MLERVEWPNLGQLQRTKTNTVLATEWCLVLARHWHENRQKPMCNLNTPTGASLVEAISDVPLTQCPCKIREYLQPSLHGHARTSPRPASSRNGPQLGVISRGQEAQRPCTHEIWNIVVDWCWISFKLAVNPCPPCLVWPRIAKCFRLDWTTFFPNFMGQSGSKFWQCLFLLWNTQSRIAENHDHTQQATVQIESFKNWITNFGGTFLLWYILSRVPERHNNWLWLSLLHITAKSCTSFSFGRYSVEPLSLHELSRRAASEQHVLG